MKITSEKITSEDVVLALASQIAKDAWVVPPRYFRRYSLSSLRCSTSYMWMCPSSHAVKSVLLSTLNVRERTASA